MVSGKPPQRDKESLLLGGFEVMLLDALRKLFVMDGTGADRDLRGPKSQYITPHPCVPDGI